MCIRDRCNWEKNFSFCLYTHLDSHNSVWYDISRIKNHANVSKTKVSRDLPSGETPTRASTAFSFWMHLDNRIWFSARVKKDWGWGNVRTLEAASDRTAAYRRIHPSKCGFYMPCLQTGIALLCVFRDAASWLWQRPWWRKGKGQSMWELHGCFVWTIIEQE